MLESLSSESSFQARFISMKGISIYSLRDAARTGSFINTNWRGVDKGGEGVGGGNSTHGTELDYTERRLTKEGQIPSETFQINILPLQC